MDKRKFENSKIFKFYKSLNPPSPLDVAGRVLAIRLYFQVFIVCLLFSYNIARLIIMEGSLVNKRDLLALYLRLAYFQKTGTRPCATPQQPTIYG